MQQHVAVIGAGIAGLACAAQLQRRGASVTLVDPGEPGEGCSYGNAGCLSRASVVPVGLPGLWKNVPKYLLDPEGPFRIDWRYAHRITPWLWRLLESSNLARVNEIADALHPLLDPSIARWRELAEWANASELIHQDGYAFVYASEAAFVGDALGRELRSARGVHLDIIKGPDIREFDPALSEKLTHMTLMPQQGHVSNPLRLSRAIATRLRAGGAAILKSSASDFEFGNGRVQRVITESGPIAVDAVVVAAGAYSKPLAAKLGSSVPLDTERGYHVMMSAHSGAPRIPVCSGEGKFFVTPMETGLRVAGSVELAGLHRPPNYQRADVLSSLVKHMLPQLDASVEQRWMGHRPSLPDSLPVLGRSPKFPNAYFDFGHGHVGLTAAPQSGLAIADLVCTGTSHKVDMHPYRAERFA